MLVLLLARVSREMGALSLAWIEELDSEPRGPFPIVSGISNLCPEKAKLKTWDEIKSEKNEKWGLFAPHNTIDAKTLVGEIRSSAFYFIFCI